MVGRCRHLGRERHQLVGLSKRPSQLLETRDPTAVVVTRRRCLPCVPARENSGDVNMSVEAVRRLLVSALDRSRVEPSKGERHFMRRSSRQASRPVRFAPFGVGAVTVRSVDEL